VGINIGEEEYPRAYVVLKKEGFSPRQTEKSVQIWVEERVAKHKRLQGGVVFVEEIPKLASGKIQRKVMREWARKDAEAVQTRLREKL
jgi:acyl-coenzyme A synthetase/AMP-(fatty) acid ligase